LLERAAVASAHEVCGDRVGALMADVGAGDRDPELAEGGDQHKHARPGRSAVSLTGDESAIDADSYAVDLLLRELRHVVDRTARGGRVRSMVVQLAESEQPPQETPGAAA
jgi:hypothetical protein